MSHLEFDNWLKNLKKIWETKNPDAVIDICADKFFWYETPFDKPLTKREQLLKEWQSVLQQDDIHITYDILSINENIGIVNWHAAFTRLPSKEKVELDGIFQVSLNDQGKCTEFRQWYCAKEVSI